MMPLRLCGEGMKRVPGSLGARFDENYMTGRKENQRHYFRREVKRFGLGAEGLIYSDEPVYRGEVAAGLANGSCTILRCHQGAVVVAPIVAVGVIAGFQCLQVLVPRDIVAINNR